MSSPLLVMPRTTPKNKKPIGRAFRRWVVKPLS
jgi:hypothetical protein